MQATPVPETSKTLPSIAKSVSVGSEMTPLHVDETCDLTDKDFVENTTVDAEKVIEKGIYYFVLKFYIYIIINFNIKMYQFFSIQVILNYYAIKSI